MQANVKIQNATPTEQTFGPWHLPPGGSLIVPHDHPAIIGTPAVVTITTTGSVPHGTHTLAQFENAVTLVGLPFFAFVLLAHIIKKLRRNR